MMEFVLWYMLRFTVWGVYTVNYHPNIQKIIHSSKSSTHNTCNHHDKHCHIQSVSQLTVNLPDKNTHLAIYSLYLKFSWSITLRNWSLLQDWLPESNSHSIGRVISGYTDVYGYIRMSLVIFGCLWLHPDVFGYIWLSIVIFGCLSL